MPGIGPGLAALFFNLIYSFISFGATSSSAQALHTEISGSALRHCPGKLGGHMGCWELKQVPPS